MQFQKAVKHDAKGRVALIGPAGSGKSFTMLKLARLLAGPTGKIAAVDTEHGSLSKYADLFDFDVIELSSFSPQNFLSALEAAEAARYDVFCADSLSHFWVGADGALEFVDNAQKRSQSRDNMSGWKDFRPWERKMIDAMIASPCHVIVTMRTKTAYEDQIGTNGKKVRVKIGLAPVQRDGMEYEFDLVGAMTEDNSLVVDKTRCSHYAGKVIATPGEKEFAPFAEWLKGEARPVALTGAPPTAAAQQTGGGGAAPSAPDPEELQVLFSRLGEPGGLILARDLVQAELLRAMPTGGREEWERIRDKHGMHQPGKKSIAAVRTFLLEVWAAVEFGRSLNAEQAPAAEVAA